MVVHDSVNTAAGVRCQRVEDFDGNDGLADLPGWRMVAPDAPPYPGCDAKERRIQKRGEQ
jgi:hypothetical protein